MGKAVEKFKAGLNVKTIFYLWESHQVLFSLSSENGKGMAHLQIYQDIAVHLSE